jgi:CRP-like cAMP-binding protein
MLRPASLLPALSQAFDAPLWFGESLPPTGACYRALRRLPGRISHPLEQHVFQDAPCAYFIQDGKVEVIRNEQGQDRVIATLNKDEYFGEMALISDSPRNATVRAVKETRVAALGKDNFVKLLSVLPATKVSILQTVQARAKQVASGR